METIRTKWFLYGSILVPNNLNWIDHIAHLKNTISRGIGIINKAFSIKKCLCNLYYAFIYPYLLYCIEVWCNAITTHLHPLVILQRKIIRIINFSHYNTSTDAILLSLDILPLHKIVIYRPRTLIV